MEQIGKRVFNNASPVQAVREERDSVFLLAELRIHGLIGTAQVRVRNLSSGGLMAEMPNPVPPDSAVEIEIRGLGPIPGRVVWQTEGRAGIAFDTEIDPQLARKPITPPA